MLPSHEALRSFSSICDVCLNDVSGRVERDREHVLLVRECPAHGRREFLASRNGADFERYDRFRLATLLDGALCIDPPKRFFFITPVCNQGCHYCLNEANQYAYFDAYDLGRFEADVRALPGEHVSVVGGEPLSHPRFFEFVEIVRRHGKKLLVYTNGLAFADEALVERLVEVSGGRCEVYMTFEGFSPQLYEHLPVERARSRKVVALENLEKHGVPVGLHQTLSAAQESRPGVDQVAAMRSLVAYAMEHRCVRALAFQAVVAIGGARHLSAAEVPSVDCVMDQILAALPIEIEHGEVYALEKLFGLVSGLLRLPRCPHMQLVVLFRIGDTWTGTDTFVDCEVLNRRLDARLRRRPLTRARMLRALLVDVAASVRWRRVPALLRLAWQVLPVFLRGLDIAHVPRGILPIVATTVCDRFNYDETLARRCDKRVYSNVRGLVVTESASQMSLRQMRERAQSEAG